MLPPEYPGLADVFSGTVLLGATAMFAAFIVALFIGSLTVRGLRIAGPDADGNERVYTLNGLALFLLTLVAVAVAHGLGLFSLSALYAHFVALFVVANVFAFVLSGVLYVRGVRGGRKSPGIWRGYFYGIDAAPSWFGLDLKFFSYRPSLIGLALFNVSFAVVQYETYGEISLVMALYQAFTFFYVLNYFQFEYGMVHTWDIINERFGWMLVWGDYVLVPFFYCLPAWWLVHAPDSVTPVVAVAAALLFLFGFWLFRTANQQKHNFKQDPHVRIWGKPAKTLDGRLLISGLWGIGRHLNYTGEICIYLAFALTTGFVSFVPYLLPAWLALLLWHRSQRDERRCREKYGELWERYSRKAKFSMVPFIH